MACDLPVVLLMRVRVPGINTSLTDEKRAYAEYRVFNALAPYERAIRSAHVVLRQDPGARRQFLCTVAVDLRGTDHVKTQARAVHPIAAIDRAAIRTAWLVRRRIGQDFSLNAPAFSS